MVAIRNARYAGKTLLIGAHGEVDFDAEGIAEVPQDVAGRVRNIPGFEILGDRVEKVEADLPVIEKEKILVESVLEAESLLADPEPAPTEEIVRTPRRGRPPKTR